MNYNLKVSPLSLPDRAGGETFKMLYTHTIHYRVYLFDVHCKSTTPLSVEQKVCIFCTLLIQPTNLPPRTLHIFTGNGFFFFHISDYVCNALIINSLKEWNFRHDVSPLISSLHFASLAPRFDFSCTKVSNLLHQGFRILAPCFENETLKHRNETLRRVCFTF